MRLRPARLVMCVEVFMVYSLVYTAVSLTQLAAHTLSRSAAAQPSGVGCAPVAPAHEPSQM